MNCEKMFQVTNATIMDNYTTEGPTTEQVTNGTLQPNSSVLTHTMTPTTTTTREEPLRALGIPIAFVVLGSLIVAGLITALVISGIRQSRLMDKVERAKRWTKKKHRQRKRNQQLQQVPHYIGPPLGVDVPFVQVYQPPVRRETYV